MTRPNITFTITRLVKVIAASLAILLIATTGSAVTCDGWEASPAGRHACCVRAHHAHSGDPSAADDCCARHEQGRRSEHPTRIDSGTQIAVISNLWPAGAPAVSDVNSRSDISDVRPHPPDPFTPPLRI